MGLLLQCVRLRRIANGHPTYHDAPDTFGVEPGPGISLTLVLGSSAVRLYAEHKANNSGLVPQLFSGDAADAEADDPHGHGGVHGVRAPVGRARGLGRSLGAVELAAGCADAVCSRCAALRTGKSPDHPRAGGNDARTGEGGRRIVDIPGGAARR